MGKIVAAQKSEKTTDFKKKEKVREIEIVRAMCAIGIILHHVSCYTSQEAPKVFYTYANGYYGALFVGIFFMISGGMMYYNHPDPKNLRVFYYKRWKSIFPMFYFVYLFFFCKNVIIAKALFYNGEPQRIILSVLGLDGYLNYKYPGYYIIGEWFLGAIILLYVAYPVYAKVLNKLNWKILFILIPLLIWQLNTNWFEIDATRNFIYCSAMFIAGMLIFKYKLCQNKTLKIVSCIISVIVLFVPIPNFGLVTMAISFIFAFLALFAVAEVTMTLPFLKAIFTWVGRLSFPLFLVQNKVIEYLVSRIVVNTYLELFKVMAIAVCLSVICAWCIRAVTQELLRTKWFSKLDKAVLSLCKNK